MVRIGGSTEKGKSITEWNYYNSAGEFRVDKEGSPILLNCLMYKMCYYRFGQIYTEGGKTPLAVARPRDPGYSGDSCLIVFSQQASRQATTESGIWRSETKTSSWTRWRRRTRRSIGSCGFTKWRICETEGFESQLSNPRSVLPEGFITLQIVFFLLYLHSFSRARILRDSVRAYGYVFRLYPDVSQCNRHFCS